MTHDSVFKFLTMFFGTVAILAMGACTVAGLSATTLTSSDREPTVVPTPTHSATEPDRTPAQVPTPTARPEPSPTPEREATATPEPTSTPEPTETEDADDNHGDVAQDSEDTANPTPAETEPAEQESAQPGRPVEVRIDKLGVSAPFEWVGLTPEGNMEAPEGWNNVAWYEPGPPPGAQGNSVIAGHYDAPGGVAAVFYRLRDLVPGDRVTIVTEHNEELVFEVTDVETVHVSNAPLERIFGESERRNLNLITCEGAWDPSTGMYDQRLIVYTTLISG